MTLKLPRPIGEYFAAHNAHDVARAAGYFAEDAAVRDEGRDYLGRDAIRAWVGETSRKYRHRADVIAVKRVADRIVVTAQLSGAFPGSPIDLQYHFKLAGTQITGLEIG